MNRRLLAEKGIVGEALRGVSEGEARLMAGNPVEDARAEHDYYQQCANDALDRTGTDWVNLR